MNFQEALKYLYSLGNEVLAMKLGLTSTEKLLAALGNPQNNFLKTQIAGTNGKGSTCAFLEAICLEAGIRVGLKTSPHLVSITERIKINGAEISEKDFARHATRVREACENLVETGELESVPTFFEQVTAIAVSAFGEAKIDLAILETGLGGRFDSVTATRAEIAAITPVDYDHEKILGDTLAKIAAEKAAIIREKTRKVVVGRQKKEALDVILERCRLLDVLPVFGDCEYFAKSDSPLIDFKTGKDFYSNIRLSLEGEHQRENACLAIHLAEILPAEFGLSISKRSIESGLQNAVHKGRLELWQRREADVLFDGAHNAAGAQALKNYLEKNYAGSEITLVFGAMQDKNLAEIAAILFPRAQNLILTKADNPRSANAAELASIAEKFVDKSKIFTTETLRDALFKADEITPKSVSGKYSFICVTGSLYLVGEAQKVLSESVQKE